MGEVLQLFGGPVARLYRRSLEDQGFEVLMMTVFDVAARRGYGLARSIMKDLASVPNIPLPEAWLRVLRHLQPTELTDFLAPDEQAKWKRAIETKMGEAKERELPRVALIADVPAPFDLLVARNGLQREPSRTSRPRLTI